MSRSNSLCVALLWMFKERNQQLVYYLFNQSQVKQKMPLKAFRKRFLWILQKKQKACKWEIGHNVYISKQFEQNFLMYFHSTSLLKRKPVENIYLEHQEDLLTTIVTSYNSRNYFSARKCRTFIEWKKICHCICTVTHDTTSIYIVIILS